MTKFVLAVLLTCDPALTALFTPLRPQMGRYQVCTTPDALDAVVADLEREGGHYGTAEALEPLDAFGAAGTYDRSALARLYGGKRARVVRGWIQRGDRFESITLISPHPDPTLTHLLSGTLSIRYVIDNI